MIGKNPIYPLLYTWEPEELYEKSSLMTILYHFNEVIWSPKKSNFMHG